MANKFYELGRRGYKLPKDKLKSGLESFVSSIDNTVSDMLKTSQDKTTSLLADMPQGIPIDKVPEQLRIKATEFLTKNKTAYTDATKVIASGINAQSQRYKDAVEVINRVNTRFENLSGSLEALAVKRQASLDDPYGYSSGTSKEDRLTWSNLGNGDLYAGMTFNEDGTINYTDSQGKSKSFADFNVTPQNFEGRNIFLGLNDKFTNAKYSGKTKNWSLHAGEAKFTINQLALKIKPSGQKDMMMSDTPYLESIIGFESGTPEYEAGWDKIEQNPTDAIDGYFNTKDGYLITTLKNNYNAQRSKTATGSKAGAGGEWTYGSGKYLPVLGGNRSMPPDFANAMKISLQEAADGKETSFVFFDNKLNYDPKANNGEGNWYDDNFDYGNTKSLIDNTLMIKDPGFVKIGLGSTSSKPVELKAPTIKDTPFLPDGKIYKDGATSDDLIVTADDAADGGEAVVQRLNTRIINPPGKEYRFRLMNYEDFIEQNPDVKKGMSIPEKTTLKLGLMNLMKLYRFQIIDGNNNVVGNYSFRIDDNIPNSENPRNTVNDTKESAKEFNRVMKRLGIKLEGGAGI